MSADELIPVLLYHSVHEEGDRYAVSPRDFRAHVDAVVASGRTALTLGEIAAGLCRDAALPARPVAVTFDDGFADNLAAAEHLAAAGLRSTVFVTSGYLGRPGMLSPAGLIELAAVPGVEIGAHSMHHVHLDELPVQRIDEELAVSRDALEQIIGAKVESFAYPYGSHDRRVVRATARAGYRAAAAVKNAISHRADDPLAIARWSVVATTSAGRITEVLEGHGVPRAWGRERLRTRGFRYVRRSARLLGAEAPVPPRRAGALR